jgi:23S rRNA pseudouridine2605 synthase
MSQPERLQKIIAAAGVTSRRNAEALIEQGRVALNGRIVTRLGTKADPARDHIKVDGKLIRSFPRKMYILLNKPSKIISSVRDPQGRKKVTDLVDVHTKIYPVGRLDYDTEGLILLTNDGDFSRVVAAAGKLPKVYHVKVRGKPRESALNRLREGFLLERGATPARCKVEPLKEGENCWYQVTLMQGKNRQIREMFLAIGHPVKKLRRIRIGFLTDHNLKIGEYRHLTSREVERLLRLGGNQ